MSMESIPKDLRTARACLVCSLIKTFDQFEFDGCDNCDEFLRMKNNRDNVYDCTSSNFDGMIALMSPEDSWVAKWQRVTWPKILNFTAFWKHLEKRLWHKNIFQQEEKGSIRISGDLDN
ncbi:transcription elongation factor subunit spt4 isoform X1 [Rhodnius prolixus]|uniref:transcription elongation factor subunit spt4 isoform X1 n=1 Tax=Rhodnius prolixus TaxID=13249 RepID=UPI003D18B035